jgi:hypothetical protein
MLKLKRCSCVFQCGAAMMHLMRKLLTAFLALCLLMQVSAGMAMQVDIVFAAQASATDSMHSAQTVPPCHSDGAANTALDSSSANHSHCSQCCVSALIPTVLHFPSIAAVHSAPIAVLFNSLPAPAQRPAKPPLV